jgi:hypothetical protein
MSDYDPNLCEAFKAIEPFTVPAGGVWRHTIDFRWCGGMVQNYSHATGRHDSEPQHLGDEGTEVGGGAAPEARP